MEMTCLSVLVMLWLGQRIYGKNTVCDKMCDKFTFSNVRSYARTLSISEMANGYVWFA